MQRSILALWLVVALSLQATIVSAQTGQKAVSKGKPSTNAVAKKTTPQQGHYEGTIPENFMVAKKSDIPPGTVSVLYKRDFRGILAVAFNGNKAKHEAAIRQYLTKLGLHDVSVKLADAKYTHVSGGPGKAIYGVVDPASKTLMVKFFVPGHTMFARKSAPWRFDPEVHGKFNLDVVMYFNTKGDAKNPLVGTASRLNVRDLTHEILDLSISGEVQSFGKASIIDSNSAKHVASNLNGLLRIYTAQTGLGVVTPVMRVNTGDGTTGLSFQLSKSTPGLSQAARK